MQNGIVTYNERLIHIDDKFYTINQVAEILDMHHKTIRNFITNGRLKASKIGKQWRVSEEDLNDFLDHNKGRSGEEQVVTFSSQDMCPHFTKRTVHVSTVVEMEQIHKDQYMRISNTLIAVMNGKDPLMQNSTINMKYYEKDGKLKILLWGELDFMEEMLSTISMLDDTGYEKKP